MVEYEGGVYCDWLGQELSRGCENPLLILDCRGVNDFNAAHVADAIHVAIPSLMLKRLKKGNLSVDAVIKCNESKRKFHSRWKTGTVVLYDEDTTALEDNPTCLTSLLYEKLRDDGCCVRYLIGGFLSFQASYQEHCIGASDTEQSTILGLRNLQITDSADTTIPSTEESVPTPKDDAFPVRVLPFLFLGNAKNSADPECLDRNGITYILNVTPNVANAFENEQHYKYMQIPINDHWSQNLAVFFPAAIAFIDEARQKKCGVLVHCLAGISRSVTVTVAYIMQTQRLSLNDAYDFVKLCKPNISPNFNFMGQLLDFEQSLGTPRCSCIDKDGGFGGVEVGGLVCPKLPPTDELVVSRDRGGRNTLRVCSCAQKGNKETKTYFSSPTCTSSSVSSTSSVSSSSSLATSSASSSTAFDYDVPPTP